MYGSVGRTYIHTHIEYSLCQRVDLKQYSSVRLNITIQLDYTSNRRRSLLLFSKAIQGLALTLEGINHIYSCHGLAAGVLRVSDIFTNDILKEYLQDAAGLLVDKTEDELHATLTRNTSDGELGDHLDVVYQNLVVAHGSALSESLSSFYAA